MQGATLLFPLEDGLEVVDTEVLVWAEVGPNLSAQKVEDLLLGAVPGRKGSGRYLVLRGLLVTEIVHIVVRYKF